MPILVVDGEQLNDSSFIIKALTAKLEQGRKGKPSSMTAEEAEWFRRGAAGQLCASAPARLTRVAPLVDL